MQIRYGGAFSSNVTGEAGIKKNSASRQIFLFFALHSSAGAVQCQLRYKGDEKYLNGGGVARAMIPQIKGGPVPPFFIPEFLSSPDLKLSLLISIFISRFKVNLHD